MAFHPANEFRACGNVAPLVGAADLKPYAVMAIEVEIVVALQKLVSKFCVGNARLGFHSLFHRLFA